MAHKFSWSRGPWSFNAYKVGNLNDFSLINNAMRIGYKKNDNVWLLKAENNKIRSLKNMNLSDPDFYFTDFSAHWIRNVDKETNVGA